MLIQIVDNAERKTIGVLRDAIENASDMRFAVAFITRDGLGQILPSIQEALERDAYVEFLVGLEPSATDPVAVRELYSLSSSTPRVSLLCFVSRDASPLYHPKMYLARDDLNATAIIGSSNLTRKGLRTNIEVNVVIKDNLQSDFMSDVYNTYIRLKYHPKRVVPDEELIDRFTMLCKRDKDLGRSLGRDSEFQDLREAFYHKANTLQRPERTNSDLIGWLGLVYNALPEDEFTNQDIYQKESEFRRYYPLNLNIRAKIRQQLQVLQKLGFIEHVSPGRWKKIL